MGVQAYVFSKANGPKLRAKLGSGEIINVPRTLDKCRKGLERFSQKKIWIHVYLDTGRKQIAIQ